jgi:hypothetical protein
MSPVPSRMTMRRVIENPAVFQTFFNGQSADPRTSAQPSAQLPQRHIVPTASITCHAGVIERRQLPQQHVDLTASQHRGAPTMTGGNGQGHHVQSLVAQPPFNRRRGTSEQPAFNRHNVTAARPLFNRTRGLTTAGGEGEP